ncbi:MAG: O-antigen ligase family protein [Caldilineaceae bacterium]|nr:O-antigen ligase family protein [Caldilineaceae bacterium]
MALIVAGIASDTLSTYTILGNADSSVRLTGLVGLGLLIASSFAMFARKLVFGSGPSILYVDVWPWRLFSFFCSWNITVLLYGILRHGLAATITDVDWILWTGFAFLVMLSPSRSLFLWLALTTMALSVWQSLLGVFRLITNQGTIFLTTGGDRYVPSSASLLVAAGFTISLLLIFYVVRKPRWKLLIVAVALLQLTGIVLSFNRQVWVALAMSLGLGLFFLFKGRRLRFLVYGGSLLLIGATAVLLIANSSFVSVDLPSLLRQRIGNGDFRNLLYDPSVQFRLSAWNTALDWTLENPILGRGWGASFDFSFMVPRTGAIQVFDGLSPHNTYLWFSAKAGFPALISFLLLMAALIFKALRRFSRLARVDKRLALVLIGSLLIQLTYLIGAFWWDYLTVAYMSIPIWINTGVLAVLSSKRLFIEVANQRLSHSV